jgi:hypothetical protein
MKTLHNLNDNSQTSIRSVFNDYNKLFCSEKLSKQVFDLICDLYSNVPTLRETIISYLTSSCYYSEYNYSNNNKNNNNNNMSTNNSNDLNKFNTKSANISIRLPKLGLDFFFKPTMHIENNNNNNLNNIDNTKNYDEVNNVAFDKAVISCRLLNYLVCKFSNEIGNAIYIFFTNKISQQSIEGKIVLPLPQITYM